MTTLREKLRSRGTPPGYQPILTLGCTVGTFLSLATLATAYGFVYRITNLLNGESTSGTSTFGSIESRGKTRRVRSESDWKKYYGSSAELTEDRRASGNNTFQREILSIHASKGTCNFEETRQLFLHGVLTEALDDGTPKYYNSNILGRYMRKDYFPWQNTEET